MATCSGPLKNVPDWRWQRAMWLAENKESLIRTVDDRWVQRATKYLRRKATLSITTEKRLSAMYPEIHSAYDLRDNNATYFNWIIEAAVLARRTQDEIAEYIGLDVRTVEAYEALFYDVRTKLDKEGYILGCLLGPIVTKGFVGNDPDGFWKIIAYYGGWEHVKGCWQTGQTTPEAIQFFKAAAAQLMALKTCQAALTLQPNSYNAIETLQLGLDQMKFELEHGQNIQIDQRQAAMKSMLESVHIRVLKPGEVAIAEETRPALPVVVCDVSKADNEED